MVQRHPVMNPSPADGMCGWPAGPTQLDQSDSTFPIGSIHKLLLQIKSCMYMCIVSQGRTVASCMRLDEM